MDFRNRTPFNAIAWSAEAFNDEEFHVIALRVGYQLVPKPSTDDASPHTHSCKLLEGGGVPRLVLEDCYLGKPLLSSIRAESDLAPFKPRCDILVNATAFAPGGMAKARWPVRLRVSQPSDGTVLLDKTLSVCGPRWFERTAEGWLLSEPEPAHAVPIRWEHAYGGTSCVPEVGLNQACLTNPIGCGWVEARWFSAIERMGEAVPSRLPAPQIEYPHRPVSSLDVINQRDDVANARQMGEAVKCYANTPAGLGVVGRAWTPRLQCAGTYDDAWSKERWPHLPSDFDFAYWNAAPNDQQLVRLPPNAELELVNLVAPEHAPEGILRTVLPGHRAVTLLRLQNGSVFPFPMAIDTLILDAESLHVDLVWRTLFPRALNVRVAEARFELDPSAPIVRFRR